MCKRAGLLLMLVGLILASLAALLVLGMAQQSQQQSVQQIKQVYVVAIARDIPENTIITAEMLAVKAFPADFAPPGTVATVEEATGKYASVRLFKDAVLLRSQLDLNRKSRDVASNLPPGKVAFWMPQPDLIANAGILKPGDHIDVLLTVNMGDTAGKWYSTQTTLQNVEIFSVGSIDQAVDSGAQSANPAAAKTVASSKGGGGSALVLLLDHQDALILKLIKDTDGIIDLVLRPADDAQIVRTDGVTPDTLVDRFKFRVPPFTATQTGAGPKP